MVGSTGGRQGVVGLGGGGVKGRGVKGLVGVKE